MEDDSIRLWGCQLKRVENLRKFGDFCIVFLAGNVTISAMENKRRSVRVSAQLEGSLHQGGGLLIFGGKIADLSETGGRVLLRQHFDPGALFEIEIRWEEFKVPFKGMAKLVWIKKKDGRAFPFEAGFEFTEVDPGCRNLMANYIRRTVQREGRDVRWMS
jgi:hypothetical protein